MDDIAMYIPKAYHDYRKYHLVSEAPKDRYCAFAGTLVYCDLRYGAKQYIVARIKQDDRTNVLVMLFSETYHYKQYKMLTGKRVVVCGKASHDDQYGWSVKYAGPIIEEKAFVPRIEPVYGKIQGITDTVLLKTIKTAVEQAEEPLGPELVRRMSMMPYKEALREIHAPTGEGPLRTAIDRIQMNDMMYFAEALGRADTHGTDESPILFTKHEEMQQFVHNLPYKMTEDQEKALKEFTDTAASGRRFNTLIQGDVGCGKTVVAIAMMICACENGYQAALMAPREVLAMQHYKEIQALPGIRSAFLSSSMGVKERKETLAKIESGEIQVVVGTHSCIADAVHYHCLGLTVTDEEHLFGVRQKELLETKADAGVHAVSMSATPIPRSLATVLYGTRKNIISIHSMPAGRIPVKTAAQSGRKNTFTFMEEQIKMGHQCYVVCPAIEQNDEYGITSLEETEKIYREYFGPRGIRIGIVHGKISAEDVHTTIRKFAEGELDILMSTTVIEVGVNVPNATVMVIEQAERFGLASLHQLRGRVGRSSFQSYCILLVRNKNNPRITAMLETTDGFRIAEYDLQQRGCGDILGVRQAGNNRFVNQMLANPLKFQLASEAVKYAAENGYANHLEDIYGEHAESAGEDG